MRSLVFAVSITVSFITGAAVGPTALNIAVAQLTSELEDRLPPSSRVVPERWGRVIAVYPGKVVFEDKAGAIRFYDIESYHVYLEIRRK